MPEHRITIQQLRNPNFKLSLKTGEHHRLVLGRNLTALLEFEDAFFRTNSAVLLPEGQEAPSDGGNALSTAGLAATFLHYVCDNPDVKVLITGHTDTTGSDGHNVVLSKYRSQAVFAATAGEREKFAEACDGPHLKSKEEKLATTKKDRLQILDWVSGEFGWPCSLAENGNDYFKAAKAFQKSYNENGKAGNAGGQALAVDGDWGPKTWGAVFDCYEAKLAESLSVQISELPMIRKHIRWVNDGTPNTACGEYHPIENIGRDNYRSQANRRVELLLFDPGQEPALACFSGACAQRACELFDPRVYQRKKVPIDQARILIRVALRTRAGELIPNAPYRITAGAKTRSARARDGIAVLVVPDRPTRCLVQWGLHDEPGIGTGDEPPSYEWNLHLDYDSGSRDEQGRKRLHNIGYSDGYPLDECVKRFQGDHELDPTGQLDDATWEVLVAEHRTLATTVESTSSSGEPT
jgi:hypothetical protein